MTPNELRESYLSAMEKCGAKRVPSASVLPENDPTTLFTGSGMQPMIPYLLGEPHPSGTNIVNVQKCVRTGDIEETGDTSHLTFFEMMGRWQLGGNAATYKREQIDYIWDWQIGELGLDPQFLYVTVYQGNAEMGIPEDEETIAIWEEKFKSVGIDPVIERNPWEHGCSRGGRIFVYDEKENWWSRAGVPENMPVGEPGGPDSEMFFDFGDSKGGIADPKDHPATETDRFLEIGNNVFMAYKRQTEGFMPLPKPNIDYGGGLERLAAAVNKNRDVYLTPFFTNPMAKLSEISGKTYAGDTRAFRIVLDHARAATFLIADGAVPSNVDAGYITRRLMRRAIRVARQLGVEKPFMADLATLFIAEADAYPLLQQNKKIILQSIEQEEEKFQKTLQVGEREILKHLENKGEITGKDAFFFYESYGFPLELTEEFIAERNMKLVERDTFFAEAKRHSELSKTASAGKFKGGLADHSEKTTAFHTATHLMLAGLREIVGDHIHQKGSNITGERIRFDFNHSEKLTPEQKEAVAQYVNDAITAGVKITMTEMPKEQAKAEGVEGSFWEKYPEVVKVYTMADPTGKVWSKELCGGPHVASAADISAFGAFSIKKEESSSAGVRRVKAVLK